MRAWPCSRTLWPSETSCTGDPGLGVSTLRPRQRDVAGQQLVSLGGELSVEPMEGEVGRVVEVDPEAEVVFEWLMCFADKKA